MHLRPLGHLSGEAVPPYHDSADPRAVGDTTIPRPRHGASTRGVTIPRPRHGASAHGETIPRPRHGASVHGETIPQPRHGASRYRVSGFAQRSRSRSEAGGGLLGALDGAPSEARRGPAGSHLEAPGAEGVVCLLVEPGGLSGG